MRGFFFFYGRFNYEKGDIFNSFILFMVPFIVVHKLHDHIQSVRAGI